MEKKREYGVRAKGGGKREYNWITGKQVVEKNTAQELIGKDRAEVW